MTEAMIVEAVKAAGGSPLAAVDPAAIGSTSSVADPAAVSRFNAAMEVTPIPFASEASAAWSSAQANNQGILHRIRALTELNKMHGPSARDLVELQYEVMNLSFQQEVVTKVADKSSNAIQTLVKNQ
jgi:type III secretion system YscI/HrpB-like protein